MKTLTWSITLIVLVAAAAGGGYWYGQQHHEAAEDAGAEKDSAATQPAEDAKPVVEVVTAPLARRPITQVVTAYGTVGAQPGDVRVLSLPFESHVTRLSVTAGQQVAVGTDLLQAQASPDALMALREAENAVAAAERDFKLLQQRFADHLATNSELAAAQQTLEMAKFKLASMVSRGVGKDQTLKAESPGVISKIDVQEGQIVPAGGPLVEIASGNRIEVVLGVEPADAITFKPGDAVKIKPVGGSGEAIEGKIRVIAQRVDPATRLTSVIVTLPPAAPLMIEMFVQGELTRTVPDALAVPRDAVLPDEDGGFAVFTVDGDHAKKHSVRVGLENDREAQILSDDLKPGDAVVIRGNYHLEDGSEVKVAEADATQPATSPASAPAEAAK